MSEQHINIEILKGGFILTYPQWDAEDSYWDEVREVITTQRKLNQKLKEVIAAVGLVGE